MTFYPGQKVVCIDDSVNPETVAYTPCRPRKGGVYTIRGIHKEAHIEGYGVFLEELPNPSIIWSDGDEREWPFRATRFRPLVENDNAATIKKFERA